MSAATKLASPPTWTLDAAHSGITFTVRHMMVTNVRGEFRSFDGTFQFDPQDLSIGGVTASIDVASINTREEKRDAHLRSADFFDAAKYPRATFVSTSARQKGEGWEVRGDLTIRDQTHEIVLSVEAPTPEVKDPYGNSKIGVAASTKIKRSQWGMTWNAALEAGGFLVGDEITIHLELELSRAQ
jgi:polyisoprenoid-binding protein YceI